MREVDFLPEWYPKVRQHRRTVALQAWITLILICGLGLWMLLVQRNVRLKQNELAALGTNLAQSEEELRKLDELLRLQSELIRQDQIFARIGRPVEMTKVMSLMSKLMPADMALLELNVDTEETIKPVSSLAGRAQQEQKPAGGESRLRFRLHGMCPNDVDLAEFLAKLTAKPFFRQVELMYSRERVEHGHVMREFEASFTLDLNPPATNVPVVASTTAGGQQAMRTLQTQAEWCNRAQWVLGLSLASMVVVFYALAYRPNSERLRSLMDQIDSRRSALTNNQSRARILPDVVIAVNSMRTRLEEFDKRLPRQPELAAFIHDITELTSQSGLQSKWEVKPGVPQRGQGYDEWPIELKFEGDFLSACSFIRRAEQMDRLTCVKGMNVRSMDDGKTGKVRVELSMNIYFLEG